MADIIFLAHRIPYPPDRGDKIRSFNILKRLCDLAPVHVAAFADDDEDMRHAEALRPMLSSLYVEKRSISRLEGAARAFTFGKPISLTMFESQDIRNWVSRILAERPIDAVFVFSGQMAQFVPKLPPETRFIMDFVDVDSAKFTEYARTTAWPLSTVYNREARKLAAFERKIAEKADRSLFVSEAEAALFRAEAGLPEDRVGALENGIDCDYFDPAAQFPRIEKPGNPLIVFTGQMDYRPNVEAVSSFAEDILPVIRHQVQSAHFAIVGRNPGRDVKRLASHEGVTVTGGVEDIRSWLAAADVVVAPLRMARGIQNKVLEAMAMGRPVVASKAAFEGIDAQDGRDLLVAQEPQEEAHLVLELLANRMRSEVIGQSARQQMLNRYVWNETLAPLARIIGRDTVQIRRSRLAAAG